MLGATMRAAVVRQFGAADVITYETAFPKPTIKEPNQVLVRVHAAGVNPVDTYIRSGTYVVLPQLPFITGKDGAGVVEAIGSAVHHVAPGDRVWFAFSTGSYAEYCLATNVFPLSTGLSFEQGAAIGTPYMTAHRALFHAANARAGQRVLIHGASGAVGLAAVQLAKSAGLEVIGTAGTEQGLKLVTETGADFVANHRDANYQQVLSNAYEKGFDVILEMLANVNLQRDLELVAMQGRIVVIGNRGTIEINPRFTMMKEAIITGIALSFATPDEMQAMADGINKAIDAGQVKPVVSKRFALEHAADAQREVIENTGTLGKIVIAID